MHVLHLVNPITQSFKINCLFNVLYKQKIAPRDEVRVQRFALSHLQHWFSETTKSLRKLNFFRIYKS